MMEVVCKLDKQWSRKAFDTFCAEVAQMIFDKLSSPPEETYMYFLPNKRKVGLARWDENPQENGWQLVFNQRITQVFGWETLQQIRYKISQHLGKLPLYEENEK